MTPVLIVLLTLLAAIVVGVRVAEPAVDRARARRRRPASAAGRPAARGKAVARERIVLSVGIR